MLGCITVHITTVPPGRTPAGSGRSPVTSSCSVADAAAAPSFASARRREAADRAQTATTALLDLRSVSQWVRRVYQPELRRETDRSLSSPATAVCIPHVCESRPHATRCACAVHGMKCGWRARDVRACEGSMVRVLYFCVPSNHNTPSIGFDGFEKVLIGTRGPRGAFLDGGERASGREQRSEDCQRSPCSPPTFPYHVSSR